ncbi:GAF domain-containing protein [Trichothermofontia sp.]
MAGLQSTSTRASPRHLAGGSPLSQLTDSNQRLQNLVQVIQQLVAARDLETIMGIVRTAARRLAQADGATFVLKDGDLCYYADEDAIAALWKGQRFPLTACISGWSMLNREPAIIPDIYTDPRIPIDAYRPTFVRSLMMTPIRTRDPVGAIGTYWARHYTPTSEEVDVLRALADTTALAMENAQLYNTLEQGVKERTAQLQQALNFEATLRRITASVRDSFDEHQILQTVVDELAQRLQLNHCLAMIEPNASAALTIVAAQKASGATPSLGDNGRMATPMLLPPPLWQWEICQFCDYGLTPTVAQTWLFSPLRDTQKLLGALYLAKASHEIFTPQEVRLVEQVTNQCAIALRQARLYQSAQQQVQALERLNRLKDDFLSTISHELRSPLASIKMAVKMLEIRLNALTLVTTEAKAIHQYLQILKEAGDREIGLIENLLDMSYLDSELEPPRLRPLLLQEVLPAITTPIWARACQHHLKVHLSVPDVLPPLVTDAHYLEHILTELLNNAVKYTPAEETITVSATTTRQGIVIRVSNSGIEIPVGEQAYIFDKFYRVPNANPWKYEGTGLGLALVKKWVTALGATIRLDSRDQQTSFILEFAQRTHT